MLSIWVFSTILALVIAYLVHYVHKWMNPKCNGVLPPGSMGIPLIGESLHVFFPSPSLDLHHFIKNRIQKYGPIFKTSLIGQSTIVSTDPKVNHFLLLEEGRSVEAWYSSTFSKLFIGDGDLRMNAVGDQVHRYMRSLVLNHFGLESLKAKLLPQLEEMICTTLNNWSQQESIELKRAVSLMVFNIGAKVMFSYDANKFPESLVEKFANFSQVMLSFPLNIPGTKFHKSLKDRTTLLDIIREQFRKRQASAEHSETHHDLQDLLDQTVQDMDRKEFLKEDFLVQLIFITIFASTDSNSSTLSLALKLVAENPSVVEQLQVEHEGILKTRQEPTSSMITWDEYKLMTFTRHVINESLRIASISPGIIRRARKDVEVNGYTIPAGWTILMDYSAQHLNPSNFKDPTAFNPWRWKDLDSSAISKNFAPFGGVGDNVLVLNSPRHCFQCFSMFWQQSTG